MLRESKRGDKPGKEGGVPGRKGAAFLKRAQAEKHPAQGTGESLFRGGGKSRGKGQELLLRSGRAL